ncbi:MBL fold metallo-hydrolase [Candidatus Hydrogenedentota bacterium]
MLIKNPPVEVTEDLMMLGTNEYPFFLFKGKDEGAIFEGGISSMAPILGEQLAELGINTDYITQLVITHAHPDHVMAVPAIRELIPGMSVLASAAAAKTVSIEKVMGFFGKADAGFNEAMFSRGAISEPSEGMSSVGTIAVDRVLKEGDKVAGSFDVLEMRGHSECGLCFHNPDSGILIVSDTTGYYLPDDDNRWATYFDGYGATLESIQRLATLDAEALCLGHNVVIKGADDIKAYFDEALSAHEAYHARIIEELKAGKSKRDIAGQLGVEAYEMSRLQPVGFFQKTCGLLVSMSMQHEGMSEDNGSQA